MDVTLLKNTMVRHPALAFTLVGTLAGLSVGLYEAKYPKREISAKDKIINLIVRVATGIFTALAVQQCGKYGLRFYRHHPRLPSF